MVVPAHKTLDEMAAGICGNRPARCLRASISDISQDATLHPTLPADNTKKKTPKMWCDAFSYLGSWSLFPKKIYWKSSSFSRKASGCTISSSVHSSACCFSMAYCANAFKRPPDFSLSLALPRYDRWFGAWRKVGCALKRDSLECNNLEPKPFFRKFFFFINATHPKWNRSLIFVTNLPSMQIFLAWKIGRFIEVQLARGSSKILFTGSLDEDLGLIWVGHFTSRIPELFSHFVVELPQWSTTCYVGNSPGRFQFSAQTPSLGDAPICVALSHVMPRPPRQHHDSAVGLST